MLNPDIDVNVALGFWPFQRLLIQTPAALAKHLQRHQIGGGLVRCVESILYPDPDEYDEECFAKLSRYPALRPVKTLNALHPQCLESLDDFRARFPIAGIALYPNYHLYELSDPRVAAIMRAAAKLRLPVLIPVRVEDERGQHWRMPVPAVPLAEIRELATAHPRTRIVALNTYAYELGPLRGDSSCPANLFLDFAYCEGPDTLHRITAGIPAKQFVFGSGTPWLTTESALAKLRLGTTATADRKRILASTKRFAPSSP